MTGTSCNAEAKYKNTKYFCVKSELSKVMMQMLEELLESACSAVHHPSATGLTMLSNKITFF